MDGEAIAMRAVRLMPLGYRRDPQPVARRHLDLRMGGLRSRSRRAVEPVKNVQEIKG